MGEMAEGSGRARERRGRPAQGPGLQMTPACRSKVPRAASLGFGGFVDSASQVAVRPTLDWGPEKSDQFAPSMHAATQQRRLGASKPCNMRAGLAHPGQRQLWTGGQEAEQKTTPTCPTVRVWPPAPGAGKLSDIDASTPLPA